MHDLLRTLIKQFLPFAQEKIGFKRPPKLFLRQDAKNAANPLGKTAFYDPQAKSVTIYTTNRHPKDIMRSLSHELVHHKQNCNGQFDDVGEMGEGYAQNNEHLRGMEREAYEVGNLCFRDWEDSIKGTIYNEHLLKGVNNTMSIKTWKNKELTTLLSEAWGFGFDLSRLNEGIEDLKAWKEEQKGGEGAKDDDDGAKDDDDGDEDDEEAVEEGFERPKSATGAGPTNKAGKLQRDVANKVPSDGRWLKENEEEGETLDEMCPGSDEEHDHDMGIEKVSYEGPEGRAAELIDELKELIMQMQGGGMVPGNRSYQEGQDEEELEERRGRGRNREGMEPDSRRRGMEEQIRRLIRKSLKNLKERKK